MPSKGKKTGNSVCRVPGRRESGCWGARSRFTDGETGGETTEGDEVSRAGSGWALNQTEPT